MKVIVSFFRLDTGEFTGQSYSGDEAGLAVNTPDGCGFKEGVHDHLARRVDLTSGTVVKHRPTAPPDTAFETYQWNDEIERHLPVPTTAGHWRAVRDMRDEMLRRSDWVVARAVDRGEEVPQAWRDYRQALRDITKQPDPLNITWPEAPA